MLAPTHESQLSFTLSQKLRLHEGECPFVVRGPVAEAIGLTHYAGGRDATYVYVSRRLAHFDTPGAASPTIDFAPDVAGTAIIYDVTAGALQGKARPFVCDLDKRFVRIYAIMPYQIEGIRARHEPRDDGFELQVEFVDAMQERIAAVLPFALELSSSDPEKRKQKGYRATSESGTYQETFRHERPEEPALLKLVVRSLLAPWEMKLSIKF